MRVHIHCIYNLPQCWVSRKRSRNAHVAFSHLHECDCQNHELNCEQTSGSSGFPASVLSLSQDPLQLIAMSSLVPLSDTS
jgi:hypothetical protein